MIFVCNRSASPVMDLTASPLMVGGLVRGAILLSDSEWGMGWLIAPLFTCSGHFVAELNPGAIAEFFATKPTTQHYKQTDLIDYLIDDKEVIVCGEPLRSSAKHGRG
jgi:hypothetical protein